MTGFLLIVNFRCFFVWGCDIWFVLELFSCLFYLWFDEVGASVDHFVLGVRIFFVFDLFGCVYVEEGEREMFFTIGEHRLRLGKDMTCIEVGNLSSC